VSQGRNDIRQGGAGAKVLFAKYTGAGFKLGGGVEYLRMDCSHALAKLPD
jgi:hypothetical protein